MLFYGIHGQILVQGLLVLLHTAILSTISWYWKKDREAINVHVYQHFCIPCRNLALHPDEDFENYREFNIQNSSGVIECCADRKHLDKQVSLFIERQTRQSKAFEGQKYLPTTCGYSEPLPSGTLSAKLVSLHYIQGENFSDILSWNETDAKSYIGSNVTYSNGRLSVRESGFYYVYSQVIFDESSISNDSDIFKTFCHFIYRHRAGTDASLDEKLIQSPQTLCDTGGFPSNGTSSVGSVFFLRDSDEVMVKVSDMQLIEFESLGNWFGLFKI